MPININETTISPSLLTQSDWMYMLRFENRCICDYSKQLLGERQNWTCTFLFKVYVKWMHFIDVNSKHLFSDLSLKSPDWWILLLQTHPEKMWPQWCSLILLVFISRKVHLSLTFSLSVSLSLSLFFIQFGLFLEINFTFFGVQYMNNLIPIVEALNSLFKRSEHSYFIIFVEFSRSVCYTCSCWWLWHTLGDGSCM